MENDYAAARADWDDRRTRLDTAIEAGPILPGRIGEFVHGLVIKHNQRVLVDSDQHLGMVEAMKRVRDGEDPDTVLHDPTYDI